MMMLSACQAARTSDAAELGVYHRLAALPAIACRTGWWRSFRQPQSVRVRHFFLATFGCNRVWRCARSSKGAKHCRLEEFSATSAGPKTVRCATTPAFRSAHLRSPRHTTARSSFSHARRTVESESRSTPGRDAASHRRPRLSVLQRDERTDADPITPNARS